MSSFNHIGDKSAQIASSFMQHVQGVADALKIEKGKASQPIGTIKEMGGRPYIKTNTGWKYHGKGTGAKAQEHVQGAKVAEHFKGVEKIEENKIPTIKLLKEIFDNEIFRGRTALNVKISKNPNGTIAIWPGAQDNLEDLQKILAKNKIKANPDKFSNHGGKGDGINDHDKENNILVIGNKETEKIEEKKKDSKNFKVGDQVVFTYNEDRYGKTKWGPSFKAFDRKVLQVDWINNPDDSISVKVPGGSIDVHKDDLKKINPDPPRSR